MPAKLQLDVLRTLQSSARHGTQTLKNSNFLERFHKTVSSFASHSSWHFFSSQFKSTAAPLSSIHEVAPYFKIQLFDLPSRHAENFGPLAASCRIQYTNCFSSSSNGQYQA
ncbi:CDG_1a_G0022950.mRNA.1.CDS.1 [Saccharomyces cerevisiae]|nr:CDG_1a_G0022950.mRNA.1.CDS.1 [Saccharomyces cerevisiae]CAI7323313.1 CDG_1a_G0022950.mRNA.1.CDS.1 [Saccharomyces cerevisiae]